MCGRYALHSHPDVVALQFGLASLPEFAPRYNIAPSARILVVRNDGGALVRWGFVPRWAKDPSIGARMNNARAETVAEKPSFREAYRKRRCLVPANGFYEWKRERTFKQPYYVRPSSGELFAFAGVWESWNGPQGPLETCAIVTTEANAAMRPVHERMPVILSRDDYGHWLAGDGDLLRPCAPEGIVVHAVSRAVNDARNESPALIEPLEPAR